MTILICVLIIVLIVMFAQGLPRIRHTRALPCHCWLCRRLASPHRPAVKAELDGHFAEWEGELAARKERP